MATGIRSGQETITARWRKIGGAWLPPVQIEFRDVFGADWGPESLELKDVRVR